MLFAPYLAGMQRAVANQEPEVQANQAAELEDLDEEGEASAEERDEVRDLPRNRSIKSGTGLNDDQSMMDADIQNQPYGSEISKGSNKKRTARQMGIAPVLSKTPTKKLRL